MKIGFGGDIHGIGKKNNVLADVATDFNKRGVKALVLPGDVYPEDFEVIRMLFPDMPIICALVKEDFARHHIGETNGKLRAPGPNWTFTKPGKDRDDFKPRIVYFQDITGKKIGFYIGHERTEDVTYRSEEELIKTLESIHNLFKDVNHAVAGHTHRQLLIIKELLYFINPGAITNSAGVAGGHEFAIIDTEKNEIVFSRIPTKKSTKELLNIGIISDSRDISERHSSFWKSLAEKFREKKVSHIIICGNLNPEDIGKEELKNFQIYFNSNLGNGNKKLPANWHLIKNKKPDKDYLNFSIGSYSFLIRLTLGAELFHQSEVQMDHLVREAKVKYPQTRIMFCGNSRIVLYAEEPDMLLINPGYGSPDGRYAIMQLPLKEITFGQIPIPA